MNTRTLKDKIFAKLFTRFPALVHRWAKTHNFVVNFDTPWTPFSKTLEECRVALVTTAGVHLKSEPPYNMGDKEGDPTCREIPSHTRASDLMITHNYYDHRDADIDINVVLPMDRLKELSREGMIGGIAPRHFSFMGHILGPYIDRLVTRTGPEVAALVKMDEVDIVFLTPA